MRRIFFWPLYPFVVASLPVLHFYLGNFRVLDPGDPLRILFFHFAVTGVLLFGGLFFWKGIHRSACALTPLLLILFKGDRIGPAGCVALLVLALVLFVFLRRSNLGLVRLTLPLNLAALVFVALPMARIMNAEWKMNSPIPAALFHEDILLATPSQAPPPDIYFLVVDGLGQPDFLEQEYPLTSAVLRDGLAARGFRVLGGSHCAYPQTALSVAATLNLGYVQELLEIPDPDCMDRRVLGDLTAHGRAVRALRGIGYQVATFPSGYPVTRLRERDIRREPAINPSFLEFYVLDDGILPLIQPLLGKGPADLSYAMRRNRLNFIFDELPRVRQGLEPSQPLFVFAHILAPHPPFVFDASGGALASAAKFGYADGSHWRGIHEEDAASYKSLYSAQLQYVMDRLEQAVDGILANAPRPPVIIIQGDHGPGSGVEWEDAAATDHRERSGIYNAWHLPPDVDIALAEDESAVNTFTLLFNGVFEAGLAPHVGRYWFAPMSRPYRFEEISPRRTPVP